jgi:hypothetical protein
MINLHQAIVSAADDMGFDSAQDLVDMLAENGLTLTAKDGSELAQLRAVVERVKATVDSPEYSLAIPLKAAIRAALAAASVRDAGPMAQPPGDWTDWSPKSLAEPTPPPRAECTVEERAILKRIARIPEFDLQCMVDNDSGEDHWTLVARDELARRAAKGSGA